MVENNNQQNNNENKQSGIETFHDYDKLVSDDTKIVYNCNDEYKIIKTHTVEGFHILKTKNINSCFIKLMQNMS